MFPPSISHGGLESDKGASRAVEAGDEAVPSPGRRSVTLCGGDAMLEPGPRRLPGRSNARARPITVETLRSGGKRIRSCRHPVQSSSIKRSRIETTCRPIAGGRAASKLRPVAMAPCRQSNGKRPTQARGLAPLCVGFAHALRHETTLDSTGRGDLTKGRRDQLSLIDSLWTCLKSMCQHRRFATKSSSTRTRPYGS